MSETITVGCRVRSYDFPRDLPDMADYYVEGIVESTTDFLEGCPRYKIRVERVVRKGLEVQSELVGDLVFPPVNGTPALFGGVTDGVRLLEGVES